MKNPRNYVGDIIYLRNICKWLKNIMELLFARLLICSRDQNLDRKYYTRVLRNSDSAKNVYLAIIYTWENNMKPTVRKNNQL